MTDDDIRKNREELQSRLPPDCRTDAANEHVEAVLLAGRITGHNSTQESTAYHSFLSGWDAAMELRSEELLREHEDLHGRLMDIELAKMRQETTPMTDLSALIHKGES